MGEGGEVDEGLVPSPPKPSGFPPEKPQTVEEKLALLKYVLDTFDFDN